MISGFICYCPDLGLYHHHQTDDTIPDKSGTVDYKFNEQELEDIVSAHLATDKKREAEFVARMTALARLHPHKFVDFTTAGEGTMDVRDPKPSPKRG